MRLSDLRYFLALLFLPTLVAQERASRAPEKVRFRAAALGHDVLLRDGGASAAPGRFPLDLQLTASTPYDRYFGSVRAVIASLEPQRATMSEACHLMKVGYSFDYVSRDPYRPEPPKLTETQRAGDCKAKALWLYDSLGDSEALFAIGKADKNSRTSHAWVYWRQGGRWLILDCTDRLDPIAADSVSPDRYVPFYSFGKGGTYRHQATRVNPAAVVNVAAPGAKTSR